MANLNTQHLNQPSPCPEEKQEGLHARLDRALASAEQVQERVQWMRTKVDICLLLGWLGVAFLFTGALSFYSFWQTYEPKPSSETSAVTVFVLLQLVGRLAPGVIMGVFAIRYMERQMAAFKRDSGYIKKVADVLREAVAPDVFPTRLEWHLFQMRLSRFDIGSGSEGESTLAMLEREERRATALKSLQNLEIPVSGEAKARP